MKQKTQSDTVSDTKGEAREFEGISYLSIAAAALGTPYSQEYLSLLARKGKLPARKLGRNWFVTKDAVVEYLGKHSESEEQKEAILPNEKICEGLRYLSLANAALLTPYSQEYLSLLARKGKLPARKLGRNWFATREAVELYLQTHPRYVLGRHQIVLVPESAKEVKSQILPSGVPDAEPALSSPSPIRLRYRLSAYAAALIVVLVTGFVSLTSVLRKEPDRSSSRDLTASIGGTLSPPGMPDGTMHSLQEIYDGIAGTYDSSVVIANQNGSLIENLKYIESNLSWASASGDIWNLNPGNVGIGTSTPTNNLSVIGNTFATGNFYSGTDSALGGAFAGKGFIALMSNPAALVGGSFENTDATGYEGFNFYNSAGTLVTSLAHSNTSAGFLPNATWFGSRNAESLHLLTNTAARFTIDSGGNVGIGDTTPTTKLDIAGNASVSGTFEVGGVLRASGGCVGCGGVASNSLDFDEFVNAMTLDTNTNIASAGFALTTSANVGIGTTTPVQKLDVNGSINISNGNALRYNNVLFAMASTSLFNYFTGGAGNLTMTGNANTANGFEALLSNTTGINNTAEGYQALRLNTTSSYNTAVGSLALAANISGAQNVALGYKALTKNTTGFAGTATGYQALTNNTTGESNTANGYTALSQNTTGTFNTAVGKDGLKNNSIGNFNVAVGAQTLNANTAGDKNSGVGMNALLDLNITAAGTGNNTAVGYSAGRGIVTGVNNTIIGANVTGLAAALSNTIIIADGAGNKRIYGDSNGNIGIGTTVPTAKLSISGTASISGTTTLKGVTYTWPSAQGASATFLRNDGSGTLTWATAGGGVASNSLDFDEFVNAMTLDTNTNIASAGFALTTSANVGIGTTTPVQKLDVAGSVNISRGSAYRYNNVLFAMASTSLNNYFTGGAGNLTMTGDRNTANGFQALLSNTTGIRNVANGYHALRLNTTGGNNTATGYLALNLNTTGANNTVTGYQAMFWNTSGEYNTAYGLNALLNNTTGGTNTALGVQAAQGNTTGTENTAIGHQALYANTVGFRNTAVGISALSNLNITAAGTGANTALGYNTGLGIVTGINNTIIGANVSGLAAALSNTIIIADGAGNKRIYGDSNGNIGIGTTVPTAKLSISGTASISGTTTFSGVTYAWPSAQGASATFLRNDGSGTLTWATAGGVASNSLDFDEFVNAMNLDASTNIASRGFAFTTSANVGIGTTTPVQKLDVKGNINISKGSSFRYNDVLFAMASTSRNNYFTGGAGNLTMTGTNNTANGYQALLLNTNGSYNTANGAQALSSLNTNSDQNTAIGYQALKANTSGSGYNTAVGSGTLAANTSGYDNTAVGVSALALNQTGLYNVAMGREAIYTNQSGTYNTAVGTQALHKIQTTSFSTAMGSKALFDQTSGNTNTAVGYNTGRGITTGTNNTIIGANVTGLAAALSNTIIIADGAGNQRIYANSTGNVGIGTTVPTAKLSISGTASISGTTTLKGVTYTWPSAQGASATFLRNDGSGTLTWATAGGGVASNSLDFDEFVASASLDTNLDIATNNRNLDIGDGKFFLNGTSGNVGIGLAAPTSLLHLAAVGFDGNLLTLQDSDGTCEHDPESGAETVICSSDLRLKSNIQDAASAVSFLAGFRIREYSTRASGDRMTGVIAQELIQTHPGQVSSTSQGFLAVQQPNPWVLVKAIQELDVRLQTLGSPQEPATTAASGITIRDSNGRLGCMVVEDVSTGEIQVQPGMCEDQPGTPTRPTETPFATDSPSPTVTETVEPTATVSPEESITPTPTQPETTPEESPEPTEEAPVVGLPETGVTSGGKVTTADMITVALVSIIALIGVPFLRKGLNRIVERWGS